MLPRLAPYLNTACRISTNSVLRTLPLGRASNVHTTPSPPCISSIRKNLSKMENDGFASFTTVNFYAGSKLNRLSWLRTESDFINGALEHDDARFIILNKLNPLIHKGGDNDGKLATLSWKEVQDIIGKSAKISGAVGDKVFGAEAYGFNLPTDEDAKKDFKKATDSIGPNNLALVFLGVDETQIPSRSLPGDLAGTKQQPAGTPYFALSISFRPPHLKKDETTLIDEFREKLEDDEKFDFIDTRALAMSKTGTWSKSDAAIVAQARTLVDWNERNQHCPACSRRQYSLWAGYKRACSSALRVATPQSEFASVFLGDHVSFEADGKGDCPSVKLLSNFSYPRTDPVIIMGVLSPDGEKILLGRQKTWPKGFYSCLAGFLEPGESLEEAVRREVHEEAGISVGRVIYHSSQPWPFPSNLMLGAFGEAVEGGQDIRLDLDNELEDARFFTREEVLNVLGDSLRSTLSKQDLEKFDENQRTLAEEERKKKAAAEAANGDGKEKPQWNTKDEGSVANVTGNDAPAKPFKIPGPTAIAHVLIASWARKEATLPPPLQSKGKM